MPFAGDWGNRPFVPDQGYIANARVFFAGYQTPNSVRPFNTALPVADRVFMPFLNATFPSHEPIARVNDHDHAHENEMP